MNTAIKNSIAILAFGFVGLFTANPNLYAAPDILVVGGLTVPSSVTVGNNLSVGISIKNKGTTSCPATTTRLQIKNTALTATVADSNYSTPAISAGQTISQTFTIAIPSGTASGTYNAYVILDRYDSAGQSDGSNDYGASGTFTIINNTVPTVQTLAATVPTTTSATINGTITSDGGSSIIDRRFD